VGQGKSQHDHEASKAADGAIDGHGGILKKVAT
jgi:hypothetical protein